MLLIDILAVILIASGLILLIWFLDKKNRARRTYKFQQDRTRGAENYEVAQAAKEQYCCECHQPIDADKDFFAGGLWFHNKCTEKRIR